MREDVHQALHRRRRHGRRVVRTPLRNPDYAPFLQRAKDAKPDALFVFVPSGEGTAVMKQFADRGLDATPASRLIGTGDVARRRSPRQHRAGGARRGDVAPLFGGAPSPENKAYVDAFMKANKGMRPNFIRSAATTACTSIYEALKKSRRHGDGEKLVDGDEGHVVDEPARPDVDRSGARATSCRPSTSARSKCATASCGTSSSTRSTT